MATAHITTPPKVYQLVLNLTEQEAQELERLTQNPLPGCGPIVTELFRLIFTTINKAI